jgi:hypothetical protein
MASKIFHVEYQYADKSGNGRWSMNVAADDVEAALKATRAEAKKLKQNIWRFTDCHAIASVDVISKARAR